MRKKRLFLIDGNSFCYRAYYAIKDLKNSKGFPTNAIYGFILMLRKLLEEEDPDYLAIAFDLKGPTFRHNIFTDYKIQRKPMPDDLVLQLEWIKKIIMAYNIPIFEKEGYEADDILATLARQISRTTKEIEIYIVTSDKDALQLVDKTIKVYSVHKDNVIYDIDMVKKRFLGLGPEHIADLMALMGDTSDNIPGVRGIGEKTAIELIKEFNDIDNLYKNLKSIKTESKRKLLADGEHSARISKELAIVDTSVPLDIDIERLSVKQPSSEILLEIFKELEFRNLAREVAPADSAICKEADYQIITKDKLDGFLKDLSRQRQFTFDCKTSDRDLFKPEMQGVSFCWQKGRAYYVPITDYALKKMKPIFEDETIKKIGHNIKYGKLILYRNNIELKGIHFDTMVASYILNPSRSSHNLEDLALEYLGHKMKSIDESSNALKNPATMDGLDIEMYSRYSCEISDVIFRLKEIFEKSLFEKEMDRLFWDIEISLIDVLFEMEKNGVKIDLKLLENLSRDIERELAKIVDDIYRMAGGEFNINSPKQLSDVLFNRLKLPAIKKTKTGFSTDVEVLERLALVHPLPRELLRYRELTKLKSTYIDTLPQLIDPDTHRVHTSFNQTVTATGRLSSSNPNLQNIPVKTEQGRLIRKAFIGEDRHFILSADYSQIELRILAHLSGDEELIGAFEKGKDVHVHTASLIFGVDEKDVTPEMRSTAKTVNFGIIYGMSAYGLSKGLLIDPQSSQRFIDAYFERYPRVKLYMEEKVEEARQTGYVTTLFNRRRYIPEINSGSLKEQQQAERIAINTPVQGSAADLIKIAMIDIYREIKAKKLSSKMILQIHDELVFEVLEEELMVLAKIVRDKMEGAVKLRVPVKVSIRYGKNWLEIEEL